MLFLNIFWKMVWGTQRVRKRRRFFGQNRNSIFPGLTEILVVWMVMLCVDPYPVNISVFATIVSRRLDSRTPTRPTSPTNRRLKEPSALIAHRAVKAERKQQPKAAGRFGYFHIGNLHSRKLAIWIPNRDVSEKVTPFKNGNFWYIMVYLCWISGVYQQFLWIPWGGFLSNCQVAPTVTTNASHQGGDTQLRLHGRWMDLATQAAEAPTQDTKKKLKLGEMMSRNGHVIYGTGTVTYGNFLLLFLLDFLYLLHLVLMFLFTFFLFLFFFCFWFCFCCGWIRNSFPEST